MPAPTWTDARWPWQTIVRIVMHESRLPEYDTYPTAPPYGPRWVGSSSPMISIARIFGAPVSVPAGKHARSTPGAPVAWRRRRLRWLTTRIPWEQRPVALNLGT